MKESFILYQSFYAPLAGLSDAEKGQILDAIFQYHAGVQVRELSPVCQMAFSFMKSQFDRNNEKYQAIVNRNKENGKNGGRPKKNPEEPKKPSGLFENPEEPKKADNDNGNVDDNVLPKGNEENLPQKSKKRKQPDALQFPFTGPEFLIAWNKLISLKNWKNKEPVTLQQALDNISKYDEEFAIDQINRAIAGNWQGLTFPDTDEKFLKWKTIQSSINQKDQIPTKQLQRCER